MTSKTTTVKVQQQCPPVTEAVIAHLDAIFPDRCARLDMSDREVWAEAGARRVIDHLKAAMQRQQNSAGLPKVL